MMKERSIGVCIILTIVTCGIYGLYWVACLTNDVNTAAGDGEGVSGGLTVLLIIVTCNIYALYWGWKQGDKIDEIKRRRGIDSSNSGILYLILCFFLPIIAWALMQDELNKFAASNN